jgi:hypothetical protein
MQQSDEISRYHYPISFSPGNHVVKETHDLQGNIQSDISIELLRTEGERTTLNLVTFLPSFSSFSTSWSTCFQPCILPYLSRRTHLPGNPTCTNINPVIGQLTSHPPRNDDYQLLTSSLGTTFHNGILTRSSNFRLCPILN